MKQHRSAADYAREYLDTRRAVDDAMLVWRGSGRHHDPNHSTVVAIDAARRERDLAGSRFHNMLRARCAGGLVIGAVARLLAVGKLTDEDLANPPRWPPPPELPGWDGDGRDVE